MFNLDTPLFRTALGFPNKSEVRRHKMKWTRSFLILGFIFGVGCQRSSSDSDLVSIRVQAPELNSSNQKAGEAALQSVPANRKACFAVVVGGAGISQSAGDSCSPVLGVFAGFAESGALLEISVPKGLARKFELFMLLL